MAIEYPIPGWINITPEEARRRIDKLTDREYEATYLSFVYTQTKVILKYIGVSPFHKLGRPVKSDRTLEIHLGRARAKLEAPTREAAAYIFVIAGCHPFYEGVKVPCVVNPLGRPERDTLERKSYHRTHL